MICVTSMKLSLLLMLSLRLKSAFGDCTSSSSVSWRRPHQIEAKLPSGVQCNVVLLFERDYSVQRHHQKVAEGLTHLMY